eukprot:SAG31_NODE_1374_length_8594_cov_57.759623_1_plen_114_part_00
MKTWKRPLRSGASAEGPGGAARGQSWTGTVSEAQRAALMRTTALAQLGLLRIMAQLQRSRSRDGHAPSTPNDGAREEEFPKAVFSPELHRAPDNSRQGRERGLLPRLEGRGEG